MKIQRWRNMLDPYDLAVREMLTKFQHLQYEYKSRGLYCPIENVTGRVKSVSSILDKIQRKNIPMDKIEEELEDIAGIRIICQFVEDIPRVVSLIRERKDMRVKLEKNYLENQKDSGYRSYHIIVYYDVRTMVGDRTIQAEIQIRTMGMDFWSTIEHSLQYKYKQNIPGHVREKLKKAAQAIEVLDRQMSEVRDEIMDAQNFQQTKASVVSEILTTIHHLYDYANERDMEKITSEFYEVYAENDTEKLYRFHRNLDLIAEGYRAQQVEFKAGSNI